MAFDADFNSSDIEFEDDAPKAFQHAGQASCAKMLDHALEDRLSSKKASKALTYTNINPRAEYKVALWTNRLQYFRENVLCVDMSKPPTGTEVERFATSIVKRVNAKSSNGVPSFGWLREGILRASEGLLIRYDYHPSRHETSRIQSTLQSLLKANKLTTDPVRAKQWAGLVIVRAMMECYLINALNKGTLCWDVVLYRAASLIWLSALQCRVGDVLLCELDKDPNNCLCWKDIDLRLERGHEEVLESLIAQVTLRSSKGQRYNGSRNLTRTLRICKDAKDNVICPIKFLIIMALRTGNVAATTVEDLLENVRQNPIKKVAWTRPDSPVFCAFSSRTSLDLPVPAATKQIQRTVSAMSDAAGILASLTSHDLRRGGARELKNLAVAPSGESDDVPAVALGHNNVSKYHGVTQDYCGPSKNDFYQLRRDEVTEDRETFGIKFAPDGLRRTKQNSSDEVTAYILSWNLGSPEDPKVRSRASYKMRNNLRNEFRKNNVRPALQPWSAGRINASMKRTGPTDVDEVDSRKKRMTSTASPSAQSPFQSGLEEENDQPNIPIDPDLLTYDGEDDAAAINAESISAMVLGGESIDVDNLDDVADLALLHSATDSLQRDISQLTQNPVQFVAFFARINTVCIHNEGRKDRLEEFDGNSRDLASRFQLYCKNSSKGCEYKTGRKSKLRDHERTCTTPRKDKPWIPRRCTGSTAKCDKTYLFPTKKEYTQHVRRYHALKEVYFEATSCTYPGCSDTKVFTSFNSYTWHLQSVHKLPDKKASLSPYLDFSDFKLPCPLPIESSICNEGKLFDVAHMTLHLRSKCHGLSDDEIGTIIKELKEKNASKGRDD